MKHDIKLIALDLDGTFLDERKYITKENADAVRAAVARGIHVVVSTGRSLTAVPLEDVIPLGVSYAITANGAQIHKLPEMEPVFSDGMEPEFACEVVGKMKKLQVHTTVFIDGQCYADKCDYEHVNLLNINDVMKDYMRTSRIYVDDLATLVREKNKKIQKFTLQFLYQNGIYHNYDRVYAMFKDDPRVNMVTGGYYNLEFSRQGISKGNSLKYLADLLGIHIDQTMACGDTQNDLDIIQTAGLGVAMANATDDVKAAADFITLSNEESGVAYAMQKLVLE